MRIRVDYDLCQGHGTCHGEAPEVFAVDDGEMRAIILQEEPEPALHDKVRRAVRFCPTNAIRTEDS